MQGDRGSQLWNAVAGAEAALDWQQHASDPCGAGYRRRGAGATNPVDPDDAGAELHSESLSQGAWSGLRGVGLLPSSVSALTELTRSMAGSRSLGSRNWTAARQARAVPSRAIHRLAGDDRRPPQIRLSTSVAISSGSCPSTSSRKSHGSFGCWRANDACAARRRSGSLLTPRPGSVRAVASEPW